MLIFSVSRSISSLSGIAEREFRNASIINKERMWLKIFLLIFLFCTFVANYGNMGFSHEIMLKGKRFFLSTSRRMKKE